MVTTRRKANLDSGDSEMEQPAPAPVPRGRRNVRSKEPVAAPAAAAPRRRLRGDVHASPLQSLTAERKPVERKGRKKTPAPAVVADEQPAEAVVAPTAEDDNEQPVFVQIEQNELENLRTELALKINTIDVLVADRQKLREEITTLRLENDRLREPSLRKIATPRSVARKPSTPNSAVPKVPEPQKELTSGEELLQRIEARRREVASALQHENAADAMEIVQEAVPATPAPATQPSTPQTNGWGLRDLFGRVTSVFRSSIPAPALVAPPATAPPRPLNVEQAQDLADSLTPIDTPTRPPAKRPNRRGPATKRNAARRNTTNNTNTKTPIKKSRSTKQNPDRRAIINLVTQNITNDAEKTAAMEWAKAQAAKLAKDSTTLGDKRKRLEEPWKLKDITEIPACKPWQTGTFGLIDEFFDDSDEEADIPEWLKLHELTKEQPPLKKRRTEHSPSLTDSQGHSTSPNDVRPRPSTVPSPMFDNSTSHTSGNNVFDEAQTQTKSDSERFSHFFEGTSFRMPSLPVPENTFTVPESSSSEEEQTWTQAPPPPPAPAHASLPVPLTAAPSVPAMPAAQSSMFASAESSDESSDPVKAQRQNALKHTPAKSSRLREFILPSPSESGTPGGLFAAAPLQNSSSLTPLPTNGVVYNIPAMVPLDLDSGVLQMAQELFESAEFKAQYAGKYCPPAPRTMEQLLYESDPESDSSLESMIFE